MFQVAILSVSSSFEDGILALAILDLRTLRPLAISGETLPWFMMIPPLRTSSRLCALDRAQEPVGRRRHLEVRDARLAKGVQYRVHKRGERAADARFADAFRAERVRGGRDRVLVDREPLHQARARHRIVHEAPGEELAGVGIVYGVLAENLPRPLCDPALHLAFDDLMIDDVAGVVHRGEAHDFGGACLGLALDLGRLAAGGEGHAEPSFG